MSDTIDSSHTKLSPAGNLAVEAWIGKREQDAELTTTDIEDLVRILRPGTSVKIWNGTSYVNLRADMLSVGERTGVIFLGGA